MTHRQIQLSSLTGTTANYVSLISILPPLTRMRLEIPPKGTIVLDWSFDLEVSTLRRITITSCLSEIPGRYTVCIYLLSPTHTWFCRWRVPKPTSTPPTTCLSRGQGLALATMYRYRYGKCCWPRKENSGQAKWQLVPLMSPTIQH